MSAFTPGPWLYRGKSDSVHTEPPSPPYTYGDQIFRFHEDDLPNDADLDLILAAPDLYEALVLLVAGIEGKCSETFIPLAKARAALEKAEGKQ